MRVEKGSVAGINVKFVHFGNLILGIATNIGPRIVYLSCAERPEFNLFGVLPDSGIRTSDGFWRVYGGHRLWSSPEAKPRSYALENKPVVIETEGDKVRILGNPETENSIQKEITIQPFSEKSLQIIHKIRNIGRWPIRMACWSISIMRQNGFALIPLKPKKQDEEGLLADRRLIVWPYDNLADERLNLGDDWISVMQNARAEKPFKIGTVANPNWIAYWVDGLALVKRISRRDSEYPDFGCTVEVYTNADMLELETIGPLEIVDPSMETSHIEEWTILKTEDSASNPGSIKEKLESLLQE